MTPDNRRSIRAQPWKTTSHLNQGIIFTWNIREERQMNYKSCMDRQNDNMTIQALAHKSMCSVVETWSYNICTYWLYLTGSNCQKRTHKCCITVFGEMIHTILTVSPLLHFSLFHANPYWLGFTMVIHTSK